MEVIDYKPLGTIFKPYVSRKRFMIIARAIAVDRVNNLSQNARSAIG